MKFEGGCYCGKIRYVAEGEPPVLSHALCPADHHQRCYRRRDNAKKQGGGDAQDEKAEKQAHQPLSCGEWPPAPGMSGWVPHESQQKPAKPGSATMRLEDAMKAARQNSEK